MEEILLKFFEDLVEHLPLHLSLQKVEEWLTTWLEHHPRLKVPFFGAAIAIGIIAGGYEAKAWWSKRRAGSTSEQK